jgi:flagellar protein FlgJ
VREIHRAGYATSPTYTTNLVRVMRRYNLYRYDG